jgi:hypothetical protein
MAEKILQDCLWNALWSRAIQTLRPAASSSGETEGNVDDREVILAQAPVDWLLISPNGYTNLLKLSSQTLTMSAQNCAQMLAKQDSSMFDSLSYMLSGRFLSAVNDL